MNELETNDLVIIFCAPLKYYQEKPSDYSASEIVDCPLCNNKMWFSEKKKMMKQVAEMANKNIFLGCFSCFEDFVKKNQSLFKSNDIVKLNI